MSYTSSWEPLVVYCLTVTNFSLQVKNQGVTTKAQFQHIRIYIFEKNHFTRSRLDNINEVLEILFGRFNVVVVNVIGQLFDYK